MSENPDNYLAAIDRAKEELNVLNTAIERAKINLKDIELNNHDLLQARLEQLELKINEQVQLRHEANTIHATNTLLADGLDQDMKEHEADKALLVADREGYGVFVKQKEEALEAREVELSTRRVEVDAQLADIEGKINVNQQLLQDILDAQKSNALALEEIKTATVTINEAIDKRAELIEQLRLESEIVDKNKVEASKCFAAAQKDLVEAQTREQAAKDALQVTVAKEEGLKDLIIESKKAQIDAMKLSERAQKNITEANLKIAELKELKEAMASQEK